MKIEAIPAYVMRSKGRIAVLVFGFLAFAVVTLHFASIDKPPTNFPVDQSMAIEEGDTISQVADRLENKNIVRSKLYLEYLLRTRFDDSFILPGLYRFTEPVSSTKVASMITSGESSTPLDSSIVTFPEGFRIKNMHDFLPRSFREDDPLQFLAYEGFLFPDTYFIKKDYKLRDIVELMRTNFDAKIEVFQSEIDRAYYSLEDIIILASILEREANDERSMRIIAGILLKRLENDMPLQVDAVFEYILGKASNELTEEDLNIDSPYNTYRNTGLPPTPISNPGLVAIGAVLDPIETEYYYYLTDSDGNFHYAQNFESHKQNKSIYLQ